MLRMEYQFDETHPKIIIEMSPESTLDQVFEAFEGFLQAAGYRIDGYIDIVAHNQGDTDVDNNI